MSTGNQTGQQAMEQEHNGQQVEKETGAAGRVQPFPGRPQSLHSGLTAGHCCTGT